MKIHVILSLLVFVLVLAATAAGLFTQTPGSPIPYTTIRGDAAVFQGSGLYRYDPAGVAMEGMVWDAINLFIGLPLFAVAIYLSLRNTLRGQLALSGLLFYFFYVYLMAATGNSFNPLFLVYVIIFALSAVAFFINLNGINVARLPERVSQRFPRGLFIGFSFTMAGVLIILWTARVVSITTSGRFPIDFAGVSTLVSQAVDLGVVVPLLLSAGILLWRRSAWGYLLAGTGLSYGLLMCITLPAFIAVPLIQAGQVNPFEASPLLLLSLFGLVLTWLFYRNIQEDRKAEGSVPQQSPVR